MRKYCPGVGVFDTDDVETHVLQEEANEFGRFFTALHNVNGEWVLELESPEIERKMAPLSIGEAAAEFTKHNEEIPESLAAQLTE